jgi:two-component system, NarL family, sensor histidine kinase UhpB
LNRTYPFLIILLCVVALQFRAQGQTRVIDSLNSIVEAHPHDTIGINSWLQLGFEFSRNNPAKAREQFYHAIRLARSLNTVFGLSAAYSHLTTSYQNAGALDSALHYLSLLQRLAEQTPSKKEITGNFHMTAGLFYKNKGQFDVALPHMIQALEYIPMPKHALVYAGQLLNIGNTYHNLGNIEKAAEFHLQSLKSFEGLENKRGQSFCLQGLGNDFIKLKRFKESQKYYEQSLTLKEELKDHRGIISAWNGLANVYMESGRYNDAEKLLIKAVAQSRELKLTQDESRALFDLSGLERKMGKIEKARSTLAEALVIARQRGDSLLSAKITAELASFSSGKNDEDEIEKTIQTKIQVAHTSGDRAAEADAYRKMSTFYFSNRKFEKAFHMLERFHQINDSIHGQQVLVQLKQLEEQYQNDKNEKAIALLKKDQELREAVISKQKANEKIVAIVFISLVVISLVLVNQYRLINRSRRLKEIETVRNTIARDLHDDIGSGLSSIHILSKMASGANDKTVQHLNRITENAERIMESMSDIVWSINPENDSVEKMIVKMKEFAAEILEPKNIRYSFQTTEGIANTKLDVVKRKNLFLIFKESINNAAKHSEGSEVTIVIEQVGGLLRLKIKDNGRGFDSSTVRQGNGLVNMEDRARNIQGTLTRFSAPEKGTEIVAELSLT